VTVPRSRAPAKTGAASRVRARSIVFDASTSEPLEAALIVDSGNELRRAISDTSAASDASTHDRDDEKTVPDGGGDSRCGGSVFSSDPGCL